MAEYTFPRAHCADFHFLFLLVLSIITRLLPRAHIPHRRICFFSQPYSKDQIYLGPRSGAIAVTLERAISNFITQPGLLGEGANQGP